MRNFLIGVFVFACLPLVFAQTPSQASGGILTLLLAFVVVDAMRKSFGF